MSDNDIPSKSETRHPKHKRKKEKETILSQGFKSRKKIKKESFDSSLPRLSVQAGFVWDNSSSIQFHRKVESSSSEDEEMKHLLTKQNKKKKLSAAERRELAKMKEQRIREKESTLLDPNTPPQSADEFDRLVLASPNNSMCWIAYMAYHLQSAEIDKARNVARRALTTISIREEQEKLNIWIALLKLENIYGSKLSFDAALKEAVQLNDPKKIYLDLLQYYAEEKKIEEFEEMVPVLIKKFGFEKSTWPKLMRMYLKLGEHSKAQSCLQRAMIKLPKQDHLDVMLRFALLNNEFSFIEEAQAVFEKVLVQYPKRVDLWCVYVDMLVKDKLLENARHVLDRAIVQKLKPKKMKTLFKKYLEFEQKHGTNEGVERVKAKAFEYIEKPTEDT